MAEPAARMKGFYSALAGVAVIGVGVLGWMLSRPRATSIPANVPVQAADTAGFRGYLLGSDSAKVEITEYADYQCPFCQTFSTLQMPTIKERLIDTGRLRWRYRDFPLQQHSFSRVAAHSAACAD
ncbi:MAG TPA: thioredoxin domain-containing protein, partial [Gemmatimonadales bacterium]|nr:thioredoxin domain-containing protein [Gemmatimonadales bacterium]